jgi:osmoprotectant transport system permease protein
MNGQIAAAFAVLPRYLGWHVALSASALVLGLAIGLPLAVAAARAPRLRWVSLTLASLVQTIPSLALLALFYPLLLALSTALKPLHIGLPALGFLPSLLALTLYSILPILRNTVAGLRGLDPAIVEAADGLGMTRWQKLVRVEAPLAATVAMAGVRTAAVWTIGAATLSTPVGQTSLGDYIFSGLQTENWVFVLFGCAASAVLAITTDQLLGLIEIGLEKRRLGLAIGGGVALLVCAVIALLPLIGPVTVHGVAKDRYVVGAKNFSEQFILANLIEDRLHAGGAATEEKQGLGSAVAFRALAANDLDVYVDYSGTLWSNVLQRTDIPPRAVLLAELTKELKAKYNVTVLGSLGFENAYALAMKADLAKKLGVVSLADLAGYAGDLTLGADLEFLSRPEWKGIESAYGLQFKNQRSFSPTFMYRALESGQADVISAFSSDGRIAADHLVTLTDPKSAIPAYDAVVLIAPRRANDQRLIGALKPLIGAIPVQRMREANLTVDRDTDKKSPAEAARALAAAIR